MAIRDEKMKERVGRIAAMFFERESNRDALITIANVDLSPDFKRAVIYLSVFPVDKEKAVFDFAMRMRSELHEYLKANMRSRIAPHVEVRIDHGNKHMDRVNTLLKS